MQAPAAFAHSAQLREGVRDQVRSIHGHYQLLLAAASGRSSGEASTSGREEASAFEALLESAHGECLSCLLIVTMFIEPSAAVYTCFGNPSRHLQR